MSTTSRDCRRPSPSTRREFPTTPVPPFGTVTEIYDYLRLLFARIGKPHCPKCGNPVARQTVQQIVDAILNLPESSRITLLAPKIRRKKGEHREVFEAARRGGFVRVRVNGDVMLVEETDALTLDKQKWHYIDVVVDRLIIRSDTETSRVTESVETALREGEGVLTVAGRATMIWCSANSSPAFAAASACRDRAAHLQLQQPPRSLLHLHRPGLPVGS